MIDIFPWLDLETISTCNRTCETCLRNSHPDREELKSWFELHYLEMDVIEEALRQVKEMGFTGGVRLSHYNEPTMDERLPEIASLVQSYGYKAYMNTNGDYFTEKMAKDLDGKFEQIIVTLYMENPIKAQRAIWIPSLFKQTEIAVITQSEHMATHFSPKFDTAALAEQNREHPCLEPQIRVIINHRRQYLLCCDDVVGVYNLGKFPDVSIKDYWYGARHELLVNRLKEVGGRHIHKYCMACPRI